MVPAFIRSFGLMIPIRSGLVLALGVSAAFAQPTNIIEQLNPWSTSFNLRLGLGYKDNVLLSSVQETGRGFFATGVELFLLRLPIDGAQFYFFLSGEDIRYLDRDPVEKEQTLIAVAQWKKEFPSSWQVAVTGQYLYQDQVVDVSTTESGFRTAQVRGHGLTLRPSLRRNFGSQIWLELEMPATREILDDPLDPYSEFGPKVTLAHEYGHKSK